MALRRLYLLDILHKVNCLFNFMLINYLIFWIGSTTLGVCCSKISWSFTPANSKRIITTTKISFTADRSGVLGIPNITYNEIFCLKPATNFNSIPAFIVYANSYICIYKTYVTKGYKLIFHHKEDIGKIGFFLTETPYTLISFS
jgi:hypothetical protein